MSHQIAGVGLAAVSGAAVEVSTSTAAVLVGAAWLGSMLPDADRAGTRIYHRTRLERRVPVVAAFGWLARLPLRLLVLLPHRGVTHSVFACAAVAVLSALLVAVADPALAGAAGAGMAIGYGTHIAGDACTPSGVAAWAPVSRRRHWLLPRRLRVPTGSLREYAFTGLLTVGLIAATFALTGALHT
jgi:membrane-bound metal-dependent hydrolase YbcI (DUF457 family)